MAPKFHINYFVVVCLCHAFVLRQPHMVDGDDKVAALFLEFLTILVKTLIVVDVVKFVDINTGVEALEPIVLREAHESEFEALGLKDMRRLTIGDRLS